MIHIEKQSYGRGTVVFIDDKYFTDCRFDDCIITYSGGDYGWANCRFESNVQINFIGPAQRVMTFAQMFNLIGKPSDQPQQEIPGTVKGDH